MILKADKQILSQNSLSIIKYYVQDVCEYTFLNVYEIECGTLIDGLTI